jgi:hypothetical protein
MTAALTKFTPSPVTKLKMARNTIDAKFDAVRREPRLDEVRCAEYTPFPRIKAEQRPRMGFTRDVSALGMCLGVDAPESVGSLFRIEVRDPDGSSAGATIGRVVWCESARDGRFWVGLDLLCETDCREKKQLPPFSNPFS